MALVKFVPDDTAPAGTGWFTNDQGRTIYTTDLEGARSVPPASAPPSYAGDKSSPYANAVASNEGATGSAAVGTPSPMVAAFDGVGAPKKESMADVWNSIEPPAGATGVAKNVAAKAAQVVAPAAQPASVAAKAAAVVPPAGSTVEKTSTTVVQGRKAANVEKQISTDRAALEGYAGAAEQNAAAADTKAIAAQDSRIQSQQAMQAKAQADAEQAAADKKAADDRVKQLMDLPDGNLDPDRFVNGLSTGSKIGLTVLAAISGFASGMRGSATTDTSVLNVLQKRIDEDIASQKDQLQQGRLRKSNLIARAMAQGADAKQAEATARGQLWSLAATIGDLQAQRIGLEGANLAEAKKQTDAMRYQAGVHEGDLRSQEEARIQSTRETAPAAKGGAGSLELQNKAWELYQKAIDAGTDRDTAYRESGLQLLGVTKPAGASKEERGQEIKAGERSEGEAKASALMATAANLAKARGLKRNSEGKLEAGGEPASEAEQGAAEAAFRAALHEQGYDPKAADQTIKETKPGDNRLAGALQSASTLAAAPGMAAPLQALSALLTSHVTPESTAEQLNALETATAQRLNQRDRGTAMAKEVGELGFKPVKR